MTVASAQGLDVSNFQGRFPWKAQSGLAFGIYRLTQGLGGPGMNSPDPQAAWNHAQIAAGGLIRGAYHFLDPRLGGEKQAAYFVAQHASLGTLPADMLWLDNESANGESPAAVAACARAFMAELKTLLPRNPAGVYTFIDFAREGYCAGLGGYPLWLAYPDATAPAAPPPWAAWTFWQWGSRDGTDADAFNGDTAGLHSWLASFAPPSPATPPSPPAAEEPDMILVQVSKTEVPGGTAWPGVFLLDATGLHHVTSPADVKAYQAAGIKGPETISWGEYLERSAVPEDSAG
jgi:GH25 family lysozyme M1 (1,4-beta-N-acetylmuramidase)